MNRLLLGACLAAFPLLAQAAPRGFTAEDLVSLARVSEPALSPDGRRAVYTLRETDLAADRGRTDLWLVELDGGAAPRRLTSHPENDGAADWAGSNQGVFFLSSRSGSPQVWHLALNGGEATQVTQLPLDVASFRASPRGDRLVVALEVFPDCADLECTRKRLDETAAAKQRGLSYDRLFVRPFLFTARPGRSDGLDKTITLIPATVSGLNRLVVLPQTGRLRWYVASVAIGSALVLGAVLITLH